MKVGCCSLKRELLKTTQFLNGKNRKAACDFGKVPYFRAC